MIRTQMPRKTATASGLKTEVPVEVAIKKQEEPVKPKTGIWACLGVGCVVMVLLTVGVVLGGLGVPAVQKWLSDHNFVEGQTEETSGGSTGSRDIVVEENYVIDVVKRVENGVVSIAVDDASLDPSTGEVIGSSKIGTGFVVDSTGLILTNQHVVSEVGQSYVVVTVDGTEYPVESISRDDANDLAILKITADDLTVLTLGDSDLLTPGQFVVAIGTPLGEFPGSVTSGIISGLGRSITTGGGYGGGTTKIYEDVIQTDAAINPGNSGGPLLDTEGQVIGINFATTDGADNLSFALPVNRAKVKIAEYKEYGKFIIPYLGVEYVMISETDVLFYSDVVPGAFVRRVVPDSPASKAGLENGDIITEIDGEAVMNSLSALIQAHKVGDQITLSVWRDSETIEIDVVLEEAE